MAITQRNTKTLHRKEWQQMTPSPVTTAAGMFMVKDPQGIKRTALLVASATTQYQYATDEDAFALTPNMSLAGTFGAGACGAWLNWSNTLTANGGSTTSVTTATAINAAPIGETVRFLTGSQAGKEVVIESALILPGGTCTLSFPSSALSGAIVSTDTFVVSTGLYYVMNAGAVAPGIFKSIDPLTGVVSTLGTTNLPATWGTDGRLVGTPAYGGAYATGTATAGAATTLTNDAKTWTTNQWTNYQVRITAGTGIGQVRTIVSNTATVLTVATWTVTPDATSVYAIEANDDFLYLLGNNAVTMYRYSRSGNTWTVMAPTVARSGAPVAGMSASWAGNTGYTPWANESAILDGRYIYSFRGGATSTLDRFDIAGGTAGAGAWAVITYIGAAETFTTGSSYALNGYNIYIRKEATNRFFTYNIIGNNIYPWSTNTYTDGAAVIGDKMFTVALRSAPTVKWVYSLQGTGTALHRCMII